MGNNKGRSKACNTCLQRRVKCGQRSLLHMAHTLVKQGQQLIICCSIVDETHPICKRCVNANFDCRGYRESFVDGREQVLRRIQRTASLPAKTVSPLLISGPNQGVLDIIEKSSEAHRISCYFEQPPLCSSISALPWKRDICLSYLIANTTGPIATVCGNLALQSCQPDSLQMNAIKLCFRALATTFFGVSHAQKSLVHDGRRFYSLALQALSAAISESSFYDSKVLCAVFALSLHEVR
jgi:hypothetical protein